MRRTGRSREFPAGNKPVRTVLVSIACVVEALSTNRSIHNPVDGLWNESADRAEPETLERGARDVVVTANPCQNTTHRLPMANVVSIPAKSLMTGVAMHLVLL
jgi:hypothetical protein